MKQSNTNTNNNNNNDDDDALIYFNASTDNDDEIASSKDTDDDDEQDSLIPYTTPTTDEKIIAGFTQKIEPIWDGHFNYSIEFSGIMGALVILAFKLAYDSSLMYASYAKDGESYLPFPEEVSRQSEEASVWLNTLLSFYFIVLTAVKSRHAWLSYQLHKKQKTTTQLLPIVINLSLGVFYAAISSIPSIALDKKSTLINKAEVGVANTIQAIFGSIAFLMFIANSVDFIFCHKKKRPESSELKTKRAMLAHMKNKVATLHSLDDNDEIFTSYTKIMEVNADKTAEISQFIHLLLNDYRGDASKRTKTSTLLHYSSFAPKIATHSFTQFANFISTYGFIMNTIQQTAAVLNLPKSAKTITFAIGIGMSIPMYALYSKITLDTTSDLIEAIMNGFKKMLHPSKNKNLYGYKETLLSVAVVALNLSIAFYAALTAASSLTLNNDPENNTIVYSALAHVFSRFGLNLLAIVGIVFTNSCGGLELTKSGQEAIVRFGLYSREKRKVMAICEHAISHLESGLNATESTSSHATQI